MELNKDLGFWFPKWYELLVGNAKNGRCIIRGVFVFRGAFCRQSLIFSVSVELVSQLVFELRLG